MTWFNVINNLNKYIDIDVTELSWDPELINPATGQKYGSYGVIYKGPFVTNGSSTLGQNVDFDNYYYFTSMRFNTKKVICGDDFLNINNTKNYIIEMGNNNLINQNFILIEGDYTFKPYQIRGNEIKESSGVSINSRLNKYEPTTLANNNANILRQEGNVSRFSQVQVPNYFAIRLLENIPLTNSEMYDYQVTNSYPNNITQIKMFKGGTTGYSVPMFPLKNVIGNNSSPEVQNNYTGGIPGIPYGPFPIPVGTQGTVNYNNTISPAILNSRLKSINDIKDYSSNVIKPDTHSFSILYNDIVNQTKGFSGNFPFISFNINCTKRINALTFSEVAGVYDQSLQISYPNPTNSPVDNNGNLLISDIIERTYLKIIKIKQI